MRVALRFRPRVLVYNGDVDPGCNYLWAEASVAKFGRAEKHAWRPWVYGASESRVGEQLGGFVTEYEEEMLEVQASPFNRQLHPDEIR